MFLRKHSLSYIAQAQTLYPTSIRPRLQAHVFGVEDVDPHACGKGQLSQQLVVDAG